MVLLEVGELLEVVGVLAVVVGELLEVVVQLQMVGEVEEVAHPHLRPSSAAEAQLMESVKRQTLPGLGHSLHSLYTRIYIYLYLDL